MQARKSVGIFLYRPAVAFCCTVVPLCLFAAGCGGGGTDAYGVGATVPVAGKVTLAGKPLTSGGTITFVPDSGKGNTSKLQPVGTVDDQGNYTMATGTKPGAPVGAYKVLVRATVPANPKDQYSMPKSLVSDMYAEPKMTPLSVEVVENAPPGHYDLTVKGK